MIMPDKIEEKMLAPCGMDCMVCSRHCYHRNPCPGCFSLGSSSAGRAPAAPLRKSCDIRRCARERALSRPSSSESSPEKEIFRCAVCPDYPCALSEALEKHFLVRYDIDLSANNEEIRRVGSEEFLRMQKEEFTCSVCRGVISVQDQECSICQVAK